MFQLLHNGFQPVSETEMMTVEGGLSYDECFGPPHVAPDPVPPPPPPRYTGGGGGSSEHYLAD